MFNRLGSHKRIAVLVRALIVTLLGSGSLLFVSLAAAQSGGDKTSVDGDLLIQQGQVVGGNATVTRGNLALHGVVRGSVIVVTGSADIEGSVGGNVAVTGGDLKLGPSSVVGGDVILIGGRLTRDALAQVAGHVTVLAEPTTLTSTSSTVPGGRSTDLVGATFGSSWSRYLLLVGWLALGVIVLLLALVLVAILPERVRVAAATLEVEPRSALLIGAIIALLFWPVVSILAGILAMTVVGLVLVPALVIAAASALLFGLATSGLWLGRRVYDTAHHVPTYGGPHLLLDAGIGASVILCAVVVPSALMQGWIASVLWGMLYLVACAGMGATLLSRLGTLAPQGRRLVETQSV
ncbi:MAG: hypothetical protein M3014_07880 [Chloroflexota bacterium]|nr:hypothetical protein [Chloroflexota bacterium]